MLATKKYDKDTVVTFKLVNGDEIVAKVIEDTDAGFVISKPCTVIPSQQGMALVQSMFTSDLNKNIQLGKAHVMLHSPTVKDVENYYIQTTTGITPASAGGIIK